MENQQSIPQIKTIAIGIPCNDMVHINFTMCLLSLTLHLITKSIPAMVIIQQSSIIEVGRNEIVAQALKTKATHLLMLDSDMTFPHDTLTRLLAHDKDVVCCDAVQRRQPHGQVVKLENGGKIDHVNCMEDLVKLQSGSTACMLIRLEALKDIKGPYFMVTWNGEKFLGEDYFFTELLRKNGVDVWCDVALSKQIGHLGVSNFFVKSK